MTRAEREYQIARAVWLYQRLCRAIEYNWPAKQRALADRIVRWQKGADCDDVVEYFRRTAALDHEAQGNARIEEGRARGRQVMSWIPESEMREQFRRERDDA